MRDKILTGNKKGVESVMFNHLLIIVKNWLTDRSAIAALDTVLIVKRFILVQNKTNSFVVS